MLRKTLAEGRDTLREDPQWWGKSTSTVRETLSEGRDLPWREPPEQESTVRETPVEGMVYPPWNRLAEGRDALRGDSQWGEHTEVETISEGRDPPWQGPSEGESTAGRCSLRGETHYGGNPQRAYPQ